jgi:16S rRNA (uracil1498-N3)-methyltransferase
MTRRRWIADEVSENLASLVGEHADHLVRVLRGQVGQDFDIVTPGGVRRGRLKSLMPNRVEFELCEEISGPTLPEITLVLAIFKFDRMEWALEKCTELGISRIIPLIARRTDPHLAAASAKRIERWRRIARQASEQSRRAKLLEIANPAKLSEIMNSGATLRIVLDENEQQSSLRDVLKNASELREASSAEFKVILAIGPEGGWTEEEMQCLRQAGWESASLGHTILRAETAAIAATAIVTSTLLMA